MKTNFLIPNRYKKIGWIILIPSIIIGVWATVFEIEPTFLDWKVPAIFIDEFLGEKKFIGITKNNMLNEIMGVLVIISSMMVAFSKEKVEDEYISKIRLESLAWSVYFNQTVLLLSFLFIYDIAFYWVMILNMFALVWFFIVRFNFQKRKIQTPAADEE